MDPEILPFLMFTGQAEEAMRFYIALFPNAAIIYIARYGKGEPGPEGSVKKAKFRVGSQTVLCTDSFIKHDFTFTPAFSFFVSCRSEDEIHRLSEGLLENGGKALMPMGNYGFSRQFTWVSDRYGVSWQLNLD
jgi:predicted 3-demethylubiquinone-9 3-methyltransferase (glyoxalase superfamily)